MNNEVKKVFVQTWLWFKELLPLLVGIILIISMLKVSWIINNIMWYLPNNFLGVVVADIVGSLTTWNAINSYIIASCFGKLNQHILVISSFLIAWVTVWIIQLPAEIYFFWKKFVIIRNLISFVFVIIGAYLIYYLYFL